MFIKRLKFKTDFASNDVSFKKVTKIIGQNGVGKSLIKDAVLEVLCNVRGRLKDSDITLMTDVGVFEKIGGDFFCNNEKLKIKAYIERVENVVCAKVPAIKACLDTGNFLDLHPNDKRDLFFSALSVDVDADAVIDYIEKKYNKKVAEEARRYSFDVSDFKKEYKRLNKLRLELEKEILAIQTKLAEPVDTKYTPELLEKSKSVLADLKRQRDELLEKSNKGVKDELEARKVAIEKKLAIPDNSKEIERVKAEIEKAEKAIAEIKSENAVLASKKAELIKKKESIQKEIDNIESLKDCPVCKRSITDSVRKKVLSVLESDKEKIEKEIEGLSVTDTSDIEKRISELRLKLDDLLLEHIPNRDELKSELDDINKKLSGLSESVSDDEIKKLSERIEKGTRMVIEMEDALRKLDDKASLEKLIHSKQLEYDVVSALEGAFHPKGLRASVMSKVIDGAGGLLNEISESLGYGDFKIHLTDHLDNDTFVVSVGGRSISTFSDGEKQAINIALQVFIAAISNVRLVFVERSELMTENTSQKVSVMVKNAIAKGHLEQIVTLKAQEAEGKKIESETFKLIEME